MRKKHQGKSTLQADQWRTALHCWLRIGASAHQAAAVFHVLADVLYSDLTFSRAAPKKRDHLVYTTCCALHESKLMLCVIHASVTTLSAEDIDIIRWLLDEAHSECALVVCNAPFFKNQEAREAARCQQGLRWIFLSWLDIEEAIELRIRGDSTKPLLVRDYLCLAGIMPAGDVPTFSWLPGQAPIDALADRSLPNLRHLLHHLDPPALFADFGAGRGRHSLYASRLGHSLLVVERKADTFDDLHGNLQRAGVPASRMRLLKGDYIDLRPEGSERIDLLAIVGVLQHAIDIDDLVARLTHLRTVMHLPGGMIYIEMLFDMKFDGQPKLGRVNISVGAFEDILQQLFPNGNWGIERVAGPARQLLDFSGGGRSFFSEVRFVEQTAIEYLLTRFAGDQPAPTKP